MLLPRGRRGGRLRWDRCRWVTGPPLAERGRDSSSREEQNDERDLPADPPPTTANDGSQYTRRHTRAVLAHGAKVAAGPAQGRVDLAPLPSSPRSRLEKPSQLRGGGAPTSQATRTVFRWQVRAELTRRLLEEQADLKTGELPDRRERRQSR
jgi:hypothetical protein